MSLKKVKLMNSNNYFSNLYLNEDEQLKFIFNISENKDNKQVLLKLKEHLNEINDNCQILYECNVLKLHNSILHKIQLYKSSFIDPSLKLCDSFLSEIDKLKMIINNYMIKENDPDEVKLIKRVCFNIYSKCIKNNINDIDTIKKKGELLYLLERDLNIICEIYENSCGRYTIDEILKNINILINNSNNRLRQYNINDFINYTIRCSKISKEEVENSEIILLLKIYNLINFKKINNDKIDDNFIEMFNELYKFLIC